MRDETYTPFEGQRINVPVAMRVISRFHKPGRVAEIRERRVTTLHAIEWLLFVEDNLIETRLYHGARLAAYAGELEDVREGLRSKGWAEDLSARASNSA
ncbi:hypothetical protein UFOVP998_60 [uncultured Caudovirales phage]|uniref:Uncharacterized protein n=1 Tax=uncultured Caudovirales phage TaxID=2100421 RepID=A0A6J7XDJ2_9CAUD|nr:hypothetical protein UFOVP998_60 [uncultured Caudovirales phage]CAB4199554.1 hypothetical protein UFOVP1331_61 [uncultured Caudovirales phage]CAB4212611.1 hypothetical protein UFOVP1442_14 [uncultured Caudovirales phage]CAB5228064.1 hypothetical protein UFOVP1535_37 [uncultured Caudovirales phage]